jgi:hypothetical protein
VSDRRQISNTSRALILEFFNISTDSFGYSRRACRWPL